MANIGHLSEITAFGMYIFDCCTKVFELKPITSLTKKMLQEIELLQHFIL